MNDEQKSPRRKDIVIFRVEGVPVPYVRQSQRDKWEMRPSVVKYRAWADTIRLIFKPLALGGGDLVPELPALGAVHMTCLFDLPIPSSWAKWRKKEALEGSGAPIGHSTGDADNLAKGVADALNKLAYLDDCQLVSISSAKRYSETPGAIIMIDFSPLRWINEFHKSFEETFEEEVRRLDLSVGTESARRPH